MDKEIFIEFYKNCSSINKLVIDEEAIGRYKSYK